MLKTYTLLLTCAFLLGLQLLGQEQALHHIEKKNLSLDDFTIDLAIFPKDSATIERITKGDVLFEKHKSRLTIQSDQEEYWIKLELINGSSQHLERIIGLDEVFLEKVDLFYYQNNEWVHH